MEKRNNKILVTRALMPPYKEYMEAVKPLWDSHWITNMGTYHRQLEAALREYMEVPEVSLMVNGHMALELVLQAMDFPAGSEVITTPFTFISTTHAIIRNNLTPVFCDIKESDGTIDESKIEELITERTAAIVPVHVYGNICNIEEIRRIADRYGLKIIYDAAHGFGERYKGIGIGNFGDASIFSFHATKVFNSIEGGAVTFRERGLYEKLYNLKNFGIRGEEVVEEIGANAKMNEFSAIMGLCNLRHIEEEIQKRKEKYEYYIEKLKTKKGIYTFALREDVEYNYSYMPILVREEEAGMPRDELYSRLREKGIFARKYFYPLTCDQKCFGDAYSTVSLPVARKLAEEVLVLPLYGELTEEDVSEIASLI